MLGIELNEVIGIGDDINDISMWNVVGYPVVIGDAKECYKTEGRIVTDTCENAGVSQIIEKLCFENDE